MSLSRITAEKMGNLWLKLLRDDENGRILLSVEREFVNRVIRSPLLGECEVRTLHAFVRRHCVQRMDLEMIARCPERRFSDVSVARAEIQLAVHQVWDGNGSSQIRVLPSLPPHWRIGYRWPRDTYR